MTLATGVGSLPGGPTRAEAVRLVVGELPDLPHLPELPERGATASMTGRALAVVAELGADLQPAGWRLTGGGPGLDQRRARSLLGQDLDMLEEALQGYTGHLKVQVDRPLDAGRDRRAAARRQGARPTTAPAASWRRRWRRGCATTWPTYVAGSPGAGPLLLQVDEPALAAVLRAEVPTASGFGRHRAVDRPELSEHLEWLFAAATESGAEPWAHSCAAGTPARPAARRRRPRAVGRPRRAGRRPTTTCSARHSRQARAWRSASSRRSTPPRPHRPSSSPTRCSAGSTCSASTRTWSVSGSSSRRPAAWRAPRRRACALCREVATNLTCPRRELFGSPEHLPRGR